MAGAYRKTPAIGDGRLEVQPGSRQISNDTEEKSNASESLLEERISLSVWMRLRAQCGNGAACSGACCSSCANEREWPP